MCSCLWCRTHFSVLKFLTDGGYSMVKQLFTTVNRNKLLSANGTVTQHKHHKFN